MTEREITDEKQWRLFLRENFRNLARSRGMTEHEIELAIFESERRPR